MKTIDVSKNVMDRVVRLEKTRTVRWLVVFIIILSALFTLFIILTILGAHVISDRRGWDLLLLFRQDPEIIAQYWRDTLWVFWEEAPQNIIVLSGVSLLIVFMVIIKTNRKRKIVKKKLHQLEKYQ
jgi:hypothetical protein